MLHALLGKAGAEIEATNEADAAAEASRIIANTATPATTLAAPTASAATAAQPFQPARPLPTVGLHAPRTSWLDGCDENPPFRADTSPPCVGLSDEHLAVLEAVHRGEATEVQRATMPEVLERLRANRPALY